VQDVDDGDEAAWLPPPITVSVDPSNICNCKCIGCNADFVLAKDKRCKLSGEYLTELAEFLSNWGVQGVCIGGGGESLCNEHTGIFVEDLRNYDVGVGLITNGLLIKQYPELKNLDWLGVSVDAATEETWARVHGKKVVNGALRRILDNMEWLINEGVHVTYKYLVRPESTEEVYDAVGLASSIGCKHFHLRPVTPTWFEKDAPYTFTATQVERVRTQIQQAKTAFPSVEIIGVFDKVGPQWQIVHPFTKCHAVFITCIFMADGKVSFCCDNRGNPDFEIGPFNDPREILKFWGSKEHRDLMCEKCVDSCPRCTFSVFNQYFEKCVCDDGFMLDFI
jgi:MoaA/NifB/PqqE/SkfB family radical SAM enzyme